jgi:spore coat protein A, manganese oxidase
MRITKTGALFPALSVILIAGLAVLLLGSTPALAVKPAAPVQTPLSPTKIPQFAQPLDVLDLNGLTGVPVALGTNINLSICEFQTNILPPGTLGKGTAAPATWVWGYQVSNTCSNGLLPHSYLGPVVVATRHTPTQMTFWNKLPSADVANVKAYTTSTDQTLIWGDPLSLNTAPPPINFNDPLGSFDPELNMCWQAAQALVPPALMPAPCNNNYGFLAPQPTALTYTAPVPAAVHLHGGEVPSVLDGGPDSWWTPNGIYGHGYYSMGGISDAAAGKAVYSYPNGQEAAPIWFHDHMLGATRLNVYAGIAGGYVLIDPDMPLSPGLHPLGLSDTVLGTVPGQGSPAQPGTDPTLLTVPLIVQDRMFDTTGQLYFPNVGINPEHPFWVPEFVGDTIVVNGKAWPFFNVQPKRYRFIFLNGSNARAYELFLMSKTTGLKGPWMWVIGNDQGYLHAPQAIDPNLNLNGKLTMMPGERYEVIIDFSSVAGQVIEMRNTARTPYVGGAPVNGNTTGRIMRFNVAAATPGFVDNTFNPAATGATVRVNPMVRLSNPVTGTVEPGVTIHKVRRLTVNEAIGAGGPLEVLVNNTLYDGSKPRVPFIGVNSDFTPITTIWNTTYYSELPHEGETELWEIVNLTADAHPMHPHLVAFQVLNRQPLDVLGYMAAYNALYAATGMPIDGYGPPLNYNNSGSANSACSALPPGRGDPGYQAVVDPVTGTITAPCILGGNPDPAATLSLLGPPVPPMPQEIGWKDTVQALPNMVTRILVRFAKPDLPANTAADSAGYDFSPNSGHGYVWHCHIVDHEDNEMMRPFSVYANPFINSRSFVQGVNY